MNDLCGLDLDRDAWRELKRRAIDEDKTVADLMRQLINVELRR